MDDQVKARLIGATVLVVIAVALVPELLSGPKRAAGPVVVEEGRRTTRSHTIDLVTPQSSSVQPDGAASAPPTTRETPRPPTTAADSPAIRSTSEPGSPPPPVTGRSDPPAPAPSTSARPPSVEKVVTPAKVEPAAESKPLASELKTATSTPGGFAVQVGAFGSADAAGRLVAQLRQEGLAVYVAPLKRDGKTLHRVRVGPLPTREEANRVAARLKGRDLPAAVVAAD